MHETEEWVRAITKQINKKNREQYKRSLTVTDHCVWNPYDFYEMNSYNRVRASIAKKKKGSDRRLV